MPPTRESSCTPLGRREELIRHDRDGRDGPSNGVAAASHEGTKQRNKQGRSTKLRFVDLNPSHHLPVARR
ncbi:hypothetical protein K2Z84_24655, partial [Candidatus Binatia bacterium]|nr:hypothetical protein [Candidatus Binatia bacterium]